VRRLRLEAFGPRRATLGAEILVPAAVAIPLILVAYDRGGYGLATRSATAIGLWWLVLLCAGLGLLPRLGPSRGGWVAIGLFAGFCAWTLASMAWASDLAAAFLEFDRTALYLGVVLVAALSGTRARRGRWTDGLTIALAAVAVIAVLSRLFPDLFPDQGLPEFLPSAETRLSFPLGYWNGVGIFLGLAVPLLLRGAVVARTPGRVLAAAALPTVLVGIYLSSSRGGVLVAAVGGLVLIGLAAPRWRILAAGVTGAVGSLAALLFVGNEHALVDGPLASSSAASEGRAAFGVILACSAAVGAAWFYLGRLSPTPPRRAGRAVVAAAVALLAVGIVLSHPGRRLDDFKQAPQVTTTASGTVSGHLFSGAGNGRWQFWTAAWREFESAPIVGRGAGSYASWWAQHASFSYFVLNAHSLYLEVLGELGIVGFVLLTGSFGAAIVVGVRVLGRSRGDDRTTVAALLALFSAFCVGAAIDWIWQITAIGAVGAAAFGLLASPAAAAVEPRRVENDRQPRPAVRVPAVGLVVVAAWLLLCAQAIPWLADVKLRASQDAAAGGDGSGALNDAESARAIEPWASTPYLQLALVAERIGDLPAARRWIGDAIDRDEDDWRLWLVSARLEEKAGDTAAATESLERAIALNPRSPLFARLPR
jgi:hypothetical protein